MIKRKDKNRVRKQRHNRMRYTLKGTSTKPRLCVYRSLNHIYAQIIDDSQNDGMGNTLVSASSNEKSIAPEIANAKKTEVAKVVGKTIADRAKQKGIKSIVFDRSGYVYKGRIAAVAEGAREAGLEF